MGDFLQSIKPKFIKKLEKILEPPTEKKKEKKTPTLIETEQKQGAGFGQADIGTEPKKIVPNTQSILQTLIKRRKEAVPVKKPEHYKKGNPKKIKVGF